MAYKILTINPGSTSTKVGVFDDDNLTMKFSLSHPVEELSRYAHVNEQKDFRKEIILSVLREKGIKLEELSAVARRESLNPSRRHLQNQRGHACRSSEHEVWRACLQLGALIAQDIATTLNILLSSSIRRRGRTRRACPLQRPSEISKSIFHALNQKAVARQAAEKMGKV